MEFTQNDIAAIKLAFDGLPNNYQRLVTIGDVTLLLSPENIADMDLLGKVFKRIRRLNTTDFDTITEVTVPVGVHILEFVLTVIVDNKTPAKFRFNSDRMYAIFEDDTVDDIPTIVKVKRLMDATDQHLKSDPDKRYSLFPVNVDDYQDKISHFLQGEELVKRYPEAKLDDKTFAQWMIDYVTWNDKVGTARSIELSVLKLLIDDGYKANAHVNREVNSRETNEMYLEYAAGQIIACITNHFGVLPLLGIRLKRWFGLPSHK